MSMRLSLSVYQMKIVHNLPPMPLSPLCVLLVLDGDPAKVDSVV